MKNVYGRWAVVIILAIVSTLIASRMEIREDALDLLPGEAVQGDYVLLNRMGMVNRIFISLDATSLPAGADVFGALAVSAEKVGEILAQNEVFSDVHFRMQAGYSQAILEFVRGHLPALLTADDLAGISQRLVEKGLVTALNENFLLLNSPAGMAMKDQIQADPLGLGLLALKRIEGLKGELAVNIRDGFFISADGLHCLIWAESRHPLTDSGTAEKVDSLLKSALDKGLAHGVKADIIGSLPHTLANSRTIREDLNVLLSVSFVAFLVLFVVMLRDWRGILVIAVPFLAAPPAMALLSLFYTKISAMALGFGIVLIGIADDFSIHIFMALTKEQGSRREILGRLKAPLLLAAITTVIVFVVLLFSQVPSHRQMALLAIFGILTAFVLSWFLVPTLVKEEVLVVPAAEPGFRLDKYFPRSGPARGLSILVWIALLVAGCMALPRLTYNGDLKSLDVPVAQVAAAERSFHKVWGRGSGQAFVIASGADLDAALNKNDFVYSRLLAENIKDVQSLAPLLPGPEKQAANILSWHDFWKQRQTSFPGDLRKAAVAAGFTVDAFLPFEKTLVIEPRLIEPLDLVNGPLKPMVSSLLRQGDKTGQVAGNDKDLVVTILPDTKETGTVLASLAEAGSGVAVLSNSRWRGRVEKLLRQDLAELALTAGILVVLISGIYFTRPRDLLAVLAPVLSAFAAMALYDYFTTRDLNLMHVIMGIMIQGVAVDYGIFMVSACRGQGATRTSIASVSLGALSTLCGFGILALAKHPALHGLGITVLVGIGAAWPTALLVTPLLLKNDGSSSEAEKS